MTIGTSGIVPTVFTENDGLFVYGDVTIGSLGTFNDDGGHLRVQGNWINNGIYVAGGSNRRVYFIGGAQTISGSSVTNFEKLYINSGSTVTLARNIIVSHFVELNGTLDPGAGFFAAVGPGDINIRAGGELIVRASSYSGNFSAGSADNTSNTSVINYASSTTNQTIDPSISYEILKISGSMTKSLSANTAVGNNLTVEGGTLDLMTFTANRSSSGGSLSLAASTTLRIGGTNSFPANYSSVLLAPTSTVQYYGAAQQVASHSYGNLIISSSSGSVSKTMAAAPISVAGNFTSSVSAGSLTFTASNNITVLGTVNIGASTMINGSTFAHSIASNWINNGVFDGCSGTLTSNGANISFSGSGTNTFGNLAIAGNGTTMNAATSATLCGNFSTSGSGSFTHTTGGVGTMTMSGVAKTISGANIVFDDLTMASGSSVTTAASFVAAGNLVVDGSLTASSGTVSLIGAGKTISGSGGLQFAGLNVPGTISTARNLSISSNFSSSGSFTATANTATFNGTSTFSGSASLFNLTIAAASTLTMGSSASLGIAGAVTSSGTFNPTSNVPNTVIYNASGAQALVLTSFNNLTMQNGGTKTPTAGTIISGNLTIAAATTMDAGSFTHTVQGNFVNNGTFTPGTSTIQFTGNVDTSITGSTTFNAVTLNKGSANVLSLNNSITTSTIAMTQGSLHTGSNSITITSTRTGGGIILGTITRTHAFTTGVDYAFESANNFINFAAGSISGTITSVTVAVTTGPVLSFASAACINREYNITLTGGTSNNVTLRLHYEQVEVNGNAEGAMTLWRNTGIWVDQTSANTSSNVTDNWVQKTNISDVSNRWTLSEGLIKFSWTGLIGTAWGNASNWTPNGIPALTDVVHLGDLVVINQPVISPAAQVKKIYFDSTTPMTLTVSGGGSLTIQGNVDGTWSGNAVHTIALGSGSMTTFGDVILSDGTANHRIDITASTGIVNINGSLTQSGGANITFSGTGNLNIGKNYNYVSGTYTPSTGKVTYNGLNDQIVAGVTYYDLDFNKTGGTALLNSLTTVTNNMDLATGGTVSVNGTLNVNKNLNIGASTTLAVPTSAGINIGGNWTRSGSFSPGFGTVTFNGTGAQSVNATLFNNFAVNKASGTLTLTDNLDINGDVNVLGGTVDAGVYTVTRTVEGGSASMSAGTTVRFGETDLQIFNFAGVSIDAASTIEFYASAPTTIPPVTYGNLVITNGGANPKVIVGPTVVAGNLTINSGATLTTLSTTLTLQGNLVINGSFDPTLGSVVLAGTTKTLNGGFTAHELIVSGSYSLVSGNLRIADFVEVTSGGSFNAGTSTITLDGNVTNSGSYTSNGVTTFTGAQEQIVQLNNAITSGPTGVINFNGSVSPVFNSTVPPSMATVNINNTGGVTPSQPWLVAVAMNIGAGSSFNGGPFNHVVSGSFNNAGNFSTSGSVTFSPSTSVNVILGNNFTTTGSIIFGGTGQINLTDNTPNFNSVEITNTNVAGITAASNWTVAQDLFIGAGAVFKAGTGLTHQISGDMTNNGLFSGQTSTVIFDSNLGVNEIKGAGINNFNHITFATGAVFGVASDLFVTGNFTNDATTLDLQNSTVTFNGTALSLLGGSSTSDFEELVIDKSSNGVQMNADATVSNVLTLSAGQLVLNGNSMSILNQLTTAVGRTAGYIVTENTTFAGRLNWDINNEFGAHEFPFGTVAGDYIPFVFDLSSGDAGRVSVATYPTPANNLPLPPGVNHVQDQFGADNSINTVDRFFQIDILGGTTPTANITFNMTAAEVGSITTLLGQRWNGSFWDVPILGQTSGATSVTVPNVTQFSPWAVSGNSTPLPITLVDFNARQVVNQVVLDWTTASEKDNDYFEIEKSYDAKKFVSIGKQEGAGDSDQVIHYRFTDRELKEGAVYYRLKQVDLDGKSTMSHIVNLKINPAGDIALNVFPNPTTDFLNISYENGLQDNLFVTMLDGSGKVVIRGEGSGTSEPLKIDVSNLNPGTYLVQVIAGGTSRIFRVVKAE